MMREFMKYTKFLLLIFTALVTSAYSNFFISPDGKNNTEFLYGKKKQKDFVEGRIFIKNANSDLKCEGMLFTVQNQMENEKKLTPGVPYSRIKCNDGRILELRWNLDNTFKGVDQYGKNYAFTHTSKKEYKKYINTHSHSSNL